MKPVIQLWESVGLGLIVHYASGLVYSNQAGGTSNIHPQMEGVYVPLRNTKEHKEPKLISPENQLFAHFRGPKYRGTGAISGLDSADADFIDSLLETFLLSDVMTVDRERLDESHEAWVHAVIHREEKKETELKIFHGLGPYPRNGVLTWTNTD